MKYAVTGATGKFGRVAIQTLVDQIGSQNVIALARNTAKATQVLPTGIEVRPGDYTDEAQLTDSLAGVGRLLLISSQPGGAVARLTQHQNVVKAAQAAGIALIAYTSFPHVETAKSPLSSDHKATEALIKETGIQHTFLRNNWYLENEMNFIQGGQQNQPFVYSAGQGRVGWALERYYAQAAAQVILLDEPRPVYEFAGESRTYADLATAVHQVTGHGFPVKSVSDAACTQGLQQAGIDAQTAAVITSLQTLIRAGDLAETTDDLATVLGAALPALTDQVREILE